MHTQKKTWLFLAAVLLLGFTLRLVALGSVPSGLHADEASFLVNATALMETGKDEDGRLLPISLNSLIDPKPALYSYLQVPAVALIGSTPFAARLPAALLGVVSLALMFVVLRSTVSKTVSLVATAMLAISPWHIMASRATQEVILSFVFVLLAVWAFQKLVQRFSVQPLILLAISSFAAMYSYHAAKVFLPALFVSYLGVLLLQQKMALRKGVSVVAVLFVAAVASVLLQESSTRFSAVGILSSDEPQISITEQTYAATGLVSQPTLRAFYNKPVFYGRAFVSEYLEHFTADFLFLSGGEPKRYVVPFHGLLHLIELPLILLGLYAVAVKKEQTGLFFGLWLVLSPLPAALTFQETPSTIRTFAMVVPLVFFVARGLVWLLTYLEKKRAIQLATATGFIAVLLWQHSYFWMQFAVQQQVYQPWSRNNPYQTIASKLSEIDDSYDAVYVTNDLRPLYLYFVLEGLIPITELQDNPGARHTATYTLGKYTFNRDNCEFETFSESALYIAEVACREGEILPPGFSVVETVSYQDGVRVYELLEYNAVETPSAEVFTR